MNLILSVSITEQGRHNARLLPYEHHHADLAATVRSQWRKVDGLVLFCAVGIAVRIVAPLLESKHSDPAVVAVDESGRYIVPICGGHRGANSLAVDVAHVLDAHPVVTTATDTMGVPALDTLPGFAATGDIAGVTRVMLDGGKPTLVNPKNWPPPDIGEMADGVEPDSPTVVVTDSRVPDTAGQVVLHPPSLVVGVGASSEAPEREAADLLSRVLTQYGLAEASVATVATIDRRANDPVVTSLGSRVTSFTADQLAAIEVPNPSEVVAEEIGTASVAEAAALLAAGPDGELIVEKQKSAAATVAVARRAGPVGNVYVVGIGPGAAHLRTPQAVAAIRSADVVIGYDYYVDQVADLCSPAQDVIRSKLGAEIDRCRTSVKLAAAGKRVALVCSGDPGMFAMATLVLEQSADFGHPPVEIVSGVTASMACAGLVGAPLAHDHAVISLSDLLTPWEYIERRVSAAAGSDMVMVFYNPRSRRRTSQLPRAMELLSKHRVGSTPVAVVTNASRVNQEVTVTTLAGFDPSIVSMFSLVIVGSSTSYVDNGAFITPRGYQSE